MRCPRAITPAEQLMLAHIDALAARLDESMASKGSARDRLRSILQPESAPSSLSAAPHHQWRAPAPSKISSICL